MTLEAPDTPLRGVRQEDPQPDGVDVLVRVGACAVCRTDLHLIDGELPDIAYPVVPGHQVVGEVVACGPDAVLQPGCRVGIAWLGWACGDCDFCRNGQENLCDRARFNGYHLNGGYADLMLADSRFCFALDDYPQPEIAAPLLCGGLIGYRCLRMTANAQRIGIYGFGSAAHLISQVAQHQGRQIYAFVRPGDATALEFAESLGVHWAGFSDQPAPEPLDAGIIFAPIGSLVPKALRDIRKGGVIVCGGIHMSDIPGFPYADLWGERQIRSVANLTRTDAREFLALAPKVPVRCDTEVFRLEEANQALDRLRSGRLTGAAVLRIGD